MRPLEKIYTVLRWHLIVECSVLVCSNAVNAQTVAAAHARVVIISPYDQQGWALSRAVNAALGQLADSNAVEFVPQ